MAEKKIWKQPWVIYIIITSAIGLATFFVGHYTTPLAFKIDANTKEIVEVRKCIEERPTKTELQPELENIKADINEIKETQKEIYNLLLKFHIGSNKN